LSQSLFKFGQEKSNHESTPVKYSCKSISRGRRKLESTKKSMGKHKHQFVDEYEGLVGFGLDRETDEGTLTWYLQKFSDDDHMALIRERLSEEDLKALFDLLGGLLKKYLSEEEYHAVFLKDQE
jgi:hypothetical protein